MGTGGGGMGGVGGVGGVGGAGGAGGSDGGSSSAPDDDGNDQDTWIVGRGCVCTTPGGSRRSEAPWELLLLLPLAMVARRRR